MRTGLKLIEVVQTVYCLRFGLGQTQRRYENREQESDNGDDDEQFD
jgi:hypothetical protein